MGGWDEGIGNGDKEDEKEEIVSDVGMVRENVEGEKEGCENGGREEVRRIREEDTGNGRRNIREW